jgi:hypothetical protein
METTSKLKIRRLTPQMIRDELAEYEQRHGMTSARFWERYCTGQLPESAEFFHWGALCYMALRNCELRPLIKPG